MAPTIGVNLRVTGHCNQGSRRHMEDMFSVAYQQTEDELDLEYAYFGIFDGHGGHEAATFAKEHLMKAIVSQPGFWSDNDKEVLRAIKDGFIATHYAMWRNLENWPKTQSGWPSTSGTTASIAFIRRSNIYIGHVGDSCIVLGYQDPCSDHWRGVPLTRDHKPENPVEFKRISQAGGTVLQKSGVPRVVWHRPRISHKGPLTRSTHIDQIPFLAVARSLGDLWSYNADSDRFVVSPEPDVSVHHIDLTHDRCLIFGTDGLWNMLTPDEAVSIVKKAEFNNKSSGNYGQDQTWLNPSKCLVDNALNKWMKFELRADNTSAVTLLLDPLGPPHSQLLDQQSTASKQQSEFVPYHIESYKVNEGNSPSKLHSQSSGLAICTWYPHKNSSDNLNKTDELTSLSTMEELFGKKVEIYDNTKGDDSSKNSSSIHMQKENESKIKVLVPSTSKAVSPIEIESKKLPTVYSTILRHPNRNTGTVGKSTPEKDEKSVHKVIKEISTKGEETLDNKKEKNSTTGDENENREFDENINKMKLRGNLASKISSEQKVSSGLSLSKNYQKISLQSKTIKRSGRRGKKRKNFEIIKSQLDLLHDSKILRSRNKRRHSSLLETLNLMYEPRPKRRTRSEDQKKTSDSEEYRSDTENKLDEETKGTRKISKLKTKSSEAEKRSETLEESSRQNHLQERLQHNNNNSNNSNNNNNNNNNNNTSNSNNSNSNNSNSNSNTNSTLKSITTGNNSSQNGSNAQDFTPMRLRSNMPVKTLRSRNISLEICDWFLLGLTKINVNSNKRSLSKQNYRCEESSDNHKNLSKMSVLTRSSLNSTKIQMNESPQKSTVHTRSQNKRLKK